VAIAAATTAVLCGCSSSRAAKSPASAGSPRTSTSVTVPLSQAVLGTHDTPPGTTYLAKESGPQTLDDLTQTDTNGAAERQQLTAAGFQGAYRSLFVGITSGSAADPAHSIASFALIFPDSTAARSAHAILDNTVRKSSVVSKPLHTPGLGDQGGTAFVAPLTALAGNSYYLSWQKGPVVFALIDGGADAAVDQQTALDLARQLSTEAIGQQPTDASRLVLQPAIAPSGTLLDRTRSGPKRAADFGASPADQLQLQKLGITSGYGNIYLSAGLLHPTAAATANSAAGNAVTSEAQQYRDPTAAASAYHLFVQREQKLFNGHPVTTLHTAGLGDEAYGFRYVDHRTSGDVTGIGYIWRHGDLVLTIDQVGTPTFTKTDQAGQLARRLDKRLH
jgi:hypothetical protein